MRDTLTRLGEWPLEVGSDKRRKVQFVDSGMSMGIVSIQELEPDTGCHKVWQGEGVGEPRYVGLLRRAMREQARLVQLIEDMAVDHVLYGPLQALKQCLSTPSFVGIQKVYCARRAVPDSIHVRMVPTYYPHTP